MHWTGGRARTPTRSGAGHKAGDNADRAATLRVAEAAARLGVSHTTTYQPSPPGRVRIVRLRKVVRVPPVELKRQGSADYATPFEALASHYCTENALMASSTDA